MVLTPSTMLELGSKAPDFNLPRVDGRGEVSLSDFPSCDGLLVIFLSRHCPYVQHVKEELARLGKDYQETGLQIVGISPNDVENYPDDAPEQVARMSEELGFAFPVCYDEDQEVAKAFRAACTPDFFLFDGDLSLVYRGQLDASRPGNDLPVNGADLRTAIDSVLGGNEVTIEQQPSVGCNIKWKKGNEPSYFGG